MEILPGDETKVPIKIGDRTTSDVVVRLRTEEGRDDWFYCHSHVLIERSKYFADRLSEDWPTCQILDSRSCVEVYCNELDFNFHVCALRLLYVTEFDTWHGVRNTLGILRVAVRMGCDQMARACLDYLEAVPWEEADEEEILKTIPGLGSQYERILARLRPVDPMAVLGIFVSVFRFATSSPPSSLCELKYSAQEQLEYMLSEDDDAPLLSAEDVVLKSEVRGCVKDLFTRFNKLLDSLLSMAMDASAAAGAEGMMQQQELLSLLSDLSWACQILGKMEMMRDLVEYWVSASDNIVRCVGRLSGNGGGSGVLEIKLKVVEVVAKVLEAIGFGIVVLPKIERLHMVKVWLPFVRQTREARLVPCYADEELVSKPVNKMDNEVWQGLECALVSIVLALPSGVQADILAEWLSAAAAHQARYPDLSEAFEVWCYRSKTAGRRLAFLGNEHGGGGASESSDAADLF